ncbi:HAD superfamily [Striga asiatica]|uniref:HAD superfamily n=1 Tax=Striga asiatica TaxID=4170 RepID=A0A5A7P2P2_STRAF|nr:HAD superfamily [Striga asiatica]
MLQRYSLAVNRRLESEGFLPPGSRKPAPQVRLLCPRATQIGVPSRYHFTQDDSSDPTPPRKGHNKTGLAQLSLEVTRADWDPQTNPKLRVWEPDPYHRQVGSNF